MSKRRRLIALITGMLAALTVALTGGPAQAAGFTPINVWNTSHCLDNATENNAKLQMWSCTGGAEQRWQEGFDSQADSFTFLNQNTGLCITAPAWTGSVVMAFCDGSASQQWRVFAAANPLGPPSGWFDVWQNVSSGFCLSTNSVGNGTVPVMNNCDPSDQFDRWHTQ